MDKICAICMREITSEQAPILTIGGYGVPRCLCEGCSADIDEANLSHEYDAVIAAMNRLTDKARNSGAIEDRPTFEAIKEIFTAANERAEKIKEGSYDFSLDTQEEIEESDSEISEEYLETEEDRELDRRDEERQKKFDKIYGWVAFGIIIIALGFVIYKYFL